MKNSKWLIAFSVLIIIVLSVMLVISRSELSELKKEMQNNTESTSDVPVVSDESESSKTEKETEQNELSDQYKLYKNVLSQDEVEQTLFGQPISTDRNGEYRIGVKCADNGDFHAELTVYVAKDGKYEKVFSCPAVIGKNGAGKQAEGDVKTPLGTWKIGEAYGIKENPGSKIPYTVITDDMYWCGTGSNSDKYNKLIYRGDESDEAHKDDEHLIDYDGFYNYLIDMGYNKVGAPYAGNAIFIHCWKNSDSPTGGCVAISEENMVRVLTTVTPGTAVTVY